MLYIILVQDFCPLKIKITQFADGFCLNILQNLTFSNNHHVLIAGMCWLNRKIIFNLHASCLQQ